MDTQEKKWILMTGVTRGLGRALADIFRRQGFLVCGLVRPKNAATAEAFLDLVVRWELEASWEDNPKDELFNALRGKNFIGFVHAAGILGPMNDVPDASEAIAWTQWWKESAATHRINHSSAMEILMAVRGAFVPWSNSTGTRAAFAVHFSSGAALKPYAGWNAYCASKAAMLMEFKCLAAKVGATELSVLSVAPGTVMTDMMRQVLSADPVSFPALPKFKSLEQSGGLVSPEIPAQLIYSWLIESSQESVASWHGEFYDVRTNNSSTR